MSNSSSSSSSSSISIQLPLSLDLILSELCLLLTNSVDSAIENNMIPKHKWTQFEVSNLKAALMIIK